ncbi:hypothetical protein V5O48_003780 [Marasmius crinis-equi]|uniref:Uncharacterized protein n=1 Tax=Marasmius crinis-equi TaxID=585013 RepID=A0ABR3FSC0_9AGAR
MHPNSNYDWSTPMRSSAAVSSASSSHGLVAHYARQSHSPFSDPRLRGPTFRPGSSHHQTTALPANSLPSRIVTLPHSRYWGGAKVLARVEFTTNGGTSSPSLNKLAVKESAVDVPLERVLVPILKDGGQKIMFTTWDIPGCVLHQPNGFFRVPVHTAQLTSTRRSELLPITRQDLAESLAAAITERLAGIFTDICQGKAHKNYSFEETPMISDDLRIEAACAKPERLRLQALTWYEGVKFPVVILGMDFPVSLESSGSSQSQHA